MGSEAVALRYLESIEEHRTTRWFEAPCANPLDVDADKEIGAWLHSVNEHLKEVASATCSRTRGFDFDQPELKAIRILSVTAPAITTKLSLVLLRDGLFVFVSGDGEPAPSEVGLWARAVAAALQKLTRAHPEHEWWAVFGPHPGFRSRMIKALGVAVDLDRVSLREADFGYKESYPASLRIQRQQHWIPVIVRGRSTGYDWSSAAHAAHRELYLLAALLSLESDDYWTLREPPAPIEWGQPVLPESAGHLDRLGAVEEARRRQQVAQIDHGWLLSAWRQLHGAERLSRALAAYHQGVGLLEDYPSFAVVAFVATIEEVGKLVVARETPETCSACKRPMFSSSRRLFCETLELVRSQERARELTDILYKWRSAAAHSGHLFGYEMAFGARPLREERLPQGVAETFDLAVRVRAQRAAKDLLHRVLAG